MAHPSKIEAQRLQTAKAAITAIHADARITPGMRVDMLNTLRADITHAIDQLKNPRPTVTTDEEFMSLIN